MQKFNGVLLIFLLLTLHSSYAGSLDRCWTILLSIKAKTQILAVLVLSIGLLPILLKGRKFESSPTPTYTLSCRIF